MDQTQYGLVLFLLRKNKMTWASSYIEQLKLGETVSFRPRGYSMKPLIESGQLCTVVPIDPNVLRIGDIVLCHVNKNDYLHLIKDIQDEQYEIGNNLGRINGWIIGNFIYGLLVKVED